MNSRVGKRIKKFEVALTKIIGGKNWYVQSKIVADTNWKWLKMDCA